MIDRVHMYLSIAPKYAVSNAVGNIKNKGDSDRAEVLGSTKELLCVFGDFDG